MSGPLEVAVVGVACRFPGGDPAGDGKRAYWDLLCRGADAVGPVPASRWSASDFYSPEGTPGSVNNQVGAFLADLEAFDHEFFTITGGDAAAMDPHQRLALSCAWHAIEDAGVDPRALSGRPCGVYLGVMGNDWVWRTAAGATGCEFTSRQGAGTGHHMVANRLSYQLNLRGPSLTIDAACSSSLVAVHLAAGAVATGECEYAVAGGVNAMLQPVNGIYFTLLGLSAPDGRCKPFNARADGMGRGEGVGMVLLRPLAAALAAGQRVYAVIRGGAVSHNGRSNGVTAPARWGQQEAIETAYRRAGVSAAQVQFVEAHGTGTLIGDAIEVNALAAVHNVPRAAPCAVSSVKGNIGHTEGAAGIASFIKAVLAVYHRRLPASLHSTPVNPALGLGANGLRLAAEPVPLPGGRVVGAVSAFGLGGTNAHVVVSSGPPAGRPVRPGPGVFTVSAPTAPALRRNLLAQAEHVAAGPDGEVAALCHTSNRSKTSFRYRYAVVAHGRADLSRALRSAAVDELPAAGPPRRAGVRVGFLLPAIGGQLRTRLLAARSAAFRAAVAAQPAGVQWALARALVGLGVRPAVLAAVAGPAGDCAARLAVELGADLVDPAELSSARPALTHLVAIGPGASTVDTPGAACLTIVDDADPDVWYGVARVAGRLYRDGLDVRWDELYHPDQRAVRCPAPYRFADTRLPLPPARSRA